MLLLRLLAGLCLLCVAAAQEATIQFAESEGALLLGSSSSGPTIVVSQDDDIAVQRAANDLAADFGRVTGTNGTVVMVGENGMNSSAAGDGTIMIGTIGTSSLVSTLQNGSIDVSETEGKWEAYHMEVVSHPMAGVDQALVLVGADRRGTVYAIYSISHQIGVSPWYWWADVHAVQKENIYISSGRRLQGSPAVKYRGIFLNDEQPALTNWVNTRYPPCPDGNAGYNHEFWSLVYQLLLRLKANYMWPTTWGSMFYIDDALNGQVADDYGIVMGTSHTEPMTRQTIEQSTLLNGTWAWESNKKNVTAFMKEGVERTKTFDTLYTLGMRGLGDAESPTLNSTQLEEIVRVQQQLIGEVYNTSNVSTIPQMWCLYKEVGGYFAEGMTVPDDVTLLWSDDNWHDVQRLPVGNETGRSGGAGIYYHADYVGDPRDYKWIDTNSLAKYWSELTQAYERDARTIWILNVGDLKPMELAISFFLDMAYSAPDMSTPNSTYAWLSDWAGMQFGQDVAEQTAQILTNYSMYSARRKYELVDPETYSLFNYDEADFVLGQWKTLTDAAQSVYASMDESMQPAYFELVLHKCLAGMNFYETAITAAKNNLYATQKRTSTDRWSSVALNYFHQDAAITQRYHTQLDGKWNHQMDQPHFGYSYWQQPMRNMMWPLSYVQQSEVSVAGNLGVTCDGQNSTIPGDDQWHANSGTSLSLPPMDPYGPDRWIEVFARGSVSVNFNVSSEPFVSVTPSSGTLSGPSSNATDLRLTVSVDWSSVPAGSSTSLINITTTTPSGDYLNETYPYGNYQPPQIILPLNKTSAPHSFHGHVESDATVALEAEHYTTATTSRSANYSTIPSYGRTLSGLTLLPFTAPSQTPPSGPKLSYPIYIFTSTPKANVTLYMGTAMNTDPHRPLRYALAFDDEKPQTVQPNPLTTLWPLPDMWGPMVADAAMMNTTTHDLSKAGAHTLNLWLLEPGLVLQKIVVDLGGVRDSCLGPPESMML